VIVGFNTDIKHRGRVYHCQTEDKGRDNPLIETLVYTGGQIHDAHQTRYDELASGDYDEKKVVRLMEDQHRRVIGLIKSDYYLSPEEKAQVAQEEAERMRVIGARMEDERFLDELIMDWIDNEMEEEVVELIMSTDSDLVAGEPVTLQLKTSKNISRGLVAGARITVRLISTVAAPRVLFEGQTDRMGECLASFALPPMSEGNAAIIVRADADLGSAELRQLVKRA
jgi:hypothetical protein